MRLVNDKEERNNPSEFNLLGLVSHGMLSALGMTTILLGPLPLLLAQTRLVEPLPKVAAVLGAVIALVLLKLPIQVVLVCFVVGIYVADGVFRAVQFWRLLIETSLVALALSLVWLAISAGLAGASFFAHWEFLVNSFIDQIRRGVLAGQALPWDTLNMVFLREGIFIYLSLVILSLWFSVGLAAHFGVFAANSRYTGDALRGLRLPTWFIALFVLVSLIMWGQLLPSVHLANGLFRVLGSVMLIQGCVCLSEFMALLGLRPRVRTLVYSIAIGLGFYALMGVAVASTVFYRWRRYIGTRVVEEG